jgi:phage FluMu protein Com
VDEGEEEVDAPPQKCKSGEYFMVRIRCPECNRTLSIADEDERPVIRCPACKEKIARTSGDQVQRPTARTRSEEQPPPTRARGVGPAKTDWFVMLAVILPALVVWIVLGFFSVLVAGSVFLIGLAVLTIGLKRMSHAIKKKKLRDFFVEAPFYVRGSGLGGWLALYTHIYHGCQMPHLLGLWLFMEGLGTLLLSISVVVCSVFEPPLYPGWRPQVSNPTRDASQTNMPAPPQPEAPRITGDPQVDRALLELADTDGQIHSGAAERLGVMRPNEAYRAVVARKLAEAALGPQEVGRGAAVRALAEWAGPEVVPDLIRCFRQAGPLREAAAKGLRKVGAPAEKDVLALATDTEADSGTRSEAIEVLRDIGTPASIPTLQGFLDRREPFLDTRARTAIFAIKTRNKR